MKKIVSTVLLASIVGLQTLPAQAFFKMGVEKTDAVKQEQKADKKLYKKRLCPYSCGLGRRHFADPYLRFAKV